MEDFGFEIQVNEGAGETYFADENFVYSYFDFFKAKTPGVLDVIGDFPGPRGFRIGDTFDQVIALFPQDTNWVTDPNGVFYGQFDTRLYGYVSTANEDKEITLVTEDVYPFLRIFFKTMLFRILRTS